MSSTYTTTTNVFTEGDETYAGSYLMPSQSHKHVGKFRVHGKYVSTFRAGKMPNEYYCESKEAMVLRSGKKLNYINKSLFWSDAKECVINFNKRPGQQCISVKKLIWIYENYYNLISSCYHLISFYDACSLKTKEILGKLEESVKGVYKERKCITIERNGRVCYQIDYSEPLPKRETEGKYTFCNCRYTTVKGDKAIEKQGHHADEYVLKMRKIVKMYSRPHRSVLESDAFKIVNRKLNDDCRQLVFSFLSAQDIKTH